MNLKNNKIAKIALSLVIWMTNSAFKVGDNVQLATNLNGRTTLDFRKKNKNGKKINNVALLVKAGTMAKVLDYRQLASGNYGVKVRINKANGSEKVVWLYDWKDRNDDIKGCSDSSCNTETTSLAASPWAKAVTDQQATNQAPETIVANQVPEIVVTNNITSQAAPVVNEAPEENDPGQVIEEAANSILPESESELASSYKCGANASARTCMICNCFYESRGESVKGKAAVSFVVLARAHSGRSDFRSNVCSVIYQPAQFSWVRTNGKSTIYTNGKKGKNRRPVNECVQTVDYAMRFSKVRGPMWFHATTVSPKWARNLTKATTIGGHKFYTTSGYPKSFAGELPQTLADIPKLRAGAK